MSEQLRPTRLVNALKPRDLLPENWTVRSATPAAQVNEVLTKILCHDICVLIQSIHQLGNKSMFGGQGPLGAKGLLVAIVVGEKAFGAKACQHGNAHGNSWAIDRRRSWCHRPFVRGYTRPMIGGMVHTGPPAP